MSEKNIVKRSRHENVAGNPKDNINILVLPADRAKGDPQNLVGVIVDRN